jgi:hypothetical protein
MYWEGTNHAVYNTTKDLITTGQEFGDLKKEVTNKNHGAICKYSKEDYAATTDVSFETVEVNLNELAEQFTAEKKYSEEELTKATQQKDAAKQKNAAANIEKVESEKKLKKKLDETTAEQAVLQSGLIQNRVKKNTKNP